MWGGWGETAIHKSGLGAGPRRDQPCPHLDLGLLTSQTVSKHIFVVLSHPIYGLLSWNHWQFVCCLFISGKSNPWWQRHIVIPVTMWRTLARPERTSFPSSLPSLLLAFPPSLQTQQILFPGLRVQGWRAVSVRWGGVHKHRQWQHGGSMLWPKSPSDEGVPGRTLASFGVRDGFCQEEPQSCQGKRGVVC